MDKIEKNKSIQKRSQIKRRDALKEAGKTQISTWINQDTKDKLIEHQNNNNYSIIGDSIDDLAQDL